MIVVGAVRRAGVLALVPLLALLTMAAWVFASPIGAGPDDDYHLVSSWCAGPTSDESCVPPGPSSPFSQAPRALVEIACFAADSERSAACQGESWSWSTDELLPTGRWNSIGAYPPVYYAVTGAFTGSDIQTSALLMRAVSAVFFLGLLVALFVLLPSHRRPTLAWVFLLTAVPLGLFLFGTNNPSLWAWLGVGAAPVALMGFYESVGRRKVALGALFVVSAIAAAGSRSDAAIYLCVAIGAVVVMAFAHRRSFYRDSILPLVVAVGAFAVFALTYLARRGIGGFAGQVLDAEGQPVVEQPQGGAGAEPSPPVPVESESSLSGGSLLAFNLLNLPRLWTGVFGDRWGLGWLDTSMPALVPAATVAAFVLVGALGIARPTLRRALVVAGVVAVLVVLPLAILQTGDFVVGEQVQPRYLHPLIALLVVVLTLMPRDRPLVLTRVQRLLVIVALSAAHFVALHINIRRYVTGIDQQGVNLDAGAEWWWEGPIGPTAVWILGSLAYTLLVSILISSIARSAPGSAVPLRQTPEL